MKVRLVDAMPLYTPVKLYLKFIIKIKKKLKIKQLSHSHERQCKL